MRVIKNIIVFTILFYLSLLCLRALTTLVYITVDDYLLNIESDNLKQFSEKQFNFYLINAIVPDVLTIILAVFLFKKIKISKVLISISFVMALIIFRITYLEVFKLFVFFQSPYINLTILSALSLIITLGVIKKLNSIIRPV